MFCSKCGNQVADDAEFCSKCGNQIGSAPIPAGGEMIHNINASMDQAGFSANEGLHAKSSSSMARSVMQPTNDHRSNEALFKLYSKLVDPVHALEVLENKISNDQYEINSSWKVYNACQHNDLIFSLSIIFSILGAYLISGYSVYKGILAIAASKDQPSGFMWNLASENPGLYWLLPLLIGTAIGLAIGFAFRALCVKKGKREAAAHEEKWKAQLEEDQEAWNQIVDAIAPYICFVPPDYRTSEKIHFMVDSFINCRVENLKEAVLLTDTQEYRFTTIGALRNISDNTAAITAQLNEMQGTLQSIDSSSKFNAATSVAQTILTAGIYAKLP